MLTRYFPTALARAAAIIAAIAVALLAAPPPAAAAARRRHRPPRRRQPRRNGPAQGRRHAGLLGNPYFVALARGAEAAAKAANPQAKVTVLSADYDLNKQFTQIDSFIVSQVDLIPINAADARAIEPAVRKARRAGIVVVAVDVGAAGADAVVQTDNTRAGELACGFLAERLGGRGNVIIQNGPPVSAVLDRVRGCKRAGRASRPAPAVRRPDAKGLARGRPQRDAALPDALPEDRRCLHHQ